MANIKIEGMKELERSIRRLGKVPQKCVTKAAKTGSKDTLEAAKEAAPVDTGELKSGIIRKPERRTKPAKKVYDIMFDPEKNDVFVKYTKDGKRYYYPYSQEYGYMTRDGGYVPGLFFMKKSLEGENGEQFKKIVVGVLSKEISKELKRR